MNAFRESRDLFQAWGGWGDCHPDLPLWGASMLRRLAWRLTAWRTIRSMHRYVLGVA